MNDMVIVPGTQGLDVTNGLVFLGKSEPETMDFPMKIMKYGGGLVRIC